MKIRINAIFAVASGQLTLDRCMEIIDRNYRFLFFIEIYDLGFKATKTKNNNKSMPPTNLPKVGNMEKGHPNP